MTAAVVAGVAGAAAVLTAAALPAVVAGVASALVAVLVLVEDPERDDAPRNAQDAPVVAVPREAAEDDVDPLRELFESGPAADGTGLLGAQFVPTTLRGRLGVARRAIRPLSVVCFEAFETGTDGRLRAPVATDAVAAVLRRTLRDADVSGHLDDTGFVCILEDTGEDGAVWTAERIRRNLLEGGGRRRFRAGVASYPSHGLEPEELEAKARAALASARDWATDRIEVAGTT
jgi:hypothetical protein